VLPKRTTKGAKGIKILNIYTFRTFFGTLRQHIRLVWLSHGSYIMYFTDLNLKGTAKFKLFAKSIDPIVVVGTRFTDLNLHCLCDKYTGQHQAPKQGFSNNYTVV